MVLIVIYELLREGRGGTFLVKDCLAAAGLWCLGIGISQYSAIASLYKRKPQSNRVDFKGLFGTDKIVKVQI